MNYNHDSSLRHLLSGLLRWHNEISYKQVWHKHKMTRVKHVTAVPMINQHGLAG